MGIGERRGKAESLIEVLHGTYEMLSSLWKGRPGGISALVFSKNEIDPCPLLCIERKKHWRLEFREETIWIEGREEAVGSCGADKKRAASCGPLLFVSG